MATGTTVCACPPGHAGRLCNIGESLGPGSHMGCPPGAVPWGPGVGVGAASGPGSPMARHDAPSACTELLRGEWHRVPRRGQHGGVGPQLLGLELRPAVPGTSRGLGGHCSPAWPGPSRLLPVSTGWAGSVPGGGVGELPDTSAWVLAAPRRAGPTATVSICRNSKRLLGEGVRNPTLLGVPMSLSPFPLWGAV